MAISICPHCGQETEHADTEPELIALCPKCQQSNPASVPPQPANGEGRTPVCAFCLSSISAEASASSCPACRAVYHEECWRENEGCAVYGCSQVPTIEPRKPLEIPMSYWGRENKPCPACGQEILAAAMRCRFCGATFASAQPEDATAFSQRAELEKRLPAVKKTVVWIFILSLLPCLAPIGGVWGLIWYPTHKTEVQALPSLYPALCKMGIIVGLGQTVIMALVTATYALARGN